MSPVRLIVNQPGFRSFSPAELSPAVTVTSGGGPDSSAVEPQVFNSTETPLAVATARSGAPSPLKSPTTTDVEVPATLKPTTL